jgi:cytochrome c551/c552
MNDCVTEVAVRSELPQYAKAQLSAMPEPRGSAGAPAAFKLAKENACTACHDVAHKIVGPAFREVAARYKSDADAEAKLVAKVKQGGSGNWGEAAMPPQSQLSDANLKTLVEWVLAGAKTR